MWIAIVSAVVVFCALALSGSRIAGVPGAEDTARYYQHLSRFSAAFTIVSDTAMGVLGGSLKRREKLSGRLADALAYLYLASCALKRYHEEPKTRPNYALACWSAESCLYRIASRRARFRSKPSCAMRCAQARSTARRATCSTNSASLPA